MSQAHAADHAQQDLPFQQVTQHLPAPCWIADAEGNIVWVNDAWLDYTGKTPEALAREGLKVLHDPHIYGEVVRRWTETKAAAQPGEMVFPLKGRDGHFRPFLTRVVPLRDGKGDITRWFGTNTDISLLAAADARALRSEASALENETRLRLAVDAAALGVWEWRLDTNEMIYSPRAKGICGFPEDAVVTYDMVASATHPDDFPRTSAQAERALDPQTRDRSPYEYRIVLPSGEVRWVSAYGEAVFEPGPDGAQTVTRYVGTLVDITERKQADDLLRSSEAELRLALRVGRMAAWRIDRTGALSASPELNILIGLAPDARPTLEELASYYLHGELDRVRTAAAAARDRGQRQFEIEYRIRRTDGTIRWLHLRADAVVGEDGEPDGVIGVVMDITERKEDEERLKLLAREVDHRANNLLAVVDGVVALSQADDAASLQAVISGRVRALALAHRLLSETRWEGAGLQRILDEELAPLGLGGPASRVTTEGPPVALSPAAAQALAMVVHELATNAVKHGALSVEGGRVRVSWTVDDDQTLSVVWQEAGGPPVRPPVTHGFGKGLIERALGGAVRGRSELLWRPEGLVCRLSLSLAQTD